MLNCSVLVQEVENFSAYDVLMLVVTPTLNFEAYEAARDTSMPCSLRFVYAYAVMVLINPYFAPILTYDT